MRWSIFINANISVPPLLGRIHCVKTGLIVLPVLLSFQKLPVGGDLDVQRQLDIHELLVLAELAGHVLLGSLKCLLQVLNTTFGLLHSHLTTILGLRYLVLQVSALNRL